MMMLRFGEDARQECEGYLLVNPLPQDLESVSRKCCKRLPAMIIGAQSEVVNLGSIDVDNEDLAKKAVEYLSGLGHRRLAYVGGADHVSNNQDRWTGFSRACSVRAIELPQRYVLKGSSWRMDERQRQELTQLLGAADRPTAIFAGGYFFALDVYAAVTAAKLRIPQDVSVVGVDDPPSAAHLSPTLTTLKQPLVKMGYAAMTELIRRIMKEEPVVENARLKAELMVRSSATGRQAL
jgi:LacI family transcriptional regulator